MKNIAVIGAGAVGCFYGGRIARAGYCVKFLLRSGYSAVKQAGLFVHSVDGDFHITPEVYDRPEDIGEVDLVICALKTTSLDDAQRLLRPAVGKDTRILALMNGLGVEDKLAEWFPAERILGGLAFVAEAVAEIFRRAGIETHVSDCLKQARWEKLLWNVPFNTLSVTAGGVNTKQILADPGLRQLSRLLMEEVMAAAAADGAPLPASG